MKKNRRCFIYLFLIFLLAFVLVSCKKAVNIPEKPITGFKEFWDIFVYPMAGLMWVVGKTIGFGSYPVTIILSTLIVRTMAWPIYAKSNDMQLKMELVQPEMEALQRRYEGKDDPEAKQRMSIEMMQLYKKYGIGLSGCIMPFIQMPIFIGFYKTIARLPVSIAMEETNWIGDVFRGKTKMFGIDMLLKGNQAFDAAGQIIKVTGWTHQKIGIVILCVLVGLTQIISILLGNLQNKRQKEKRYANVPAYRRPTKNDQEKMTQTMMQVMLYGMCFMMILFVWESAAGLGLYWVIGNIYTTLQMWIGHRHQGKRLEKLRQKHMQTQNRGMR